MKTAWEKLRERNEYANHCYLGPLQDEKQNNLFALLDSVLNISRRDFSYWLRDKVGTLNLKHWAPMSFFFFYSLITFSFYASYCREIYWPSDWKWRQQTSGAKNARRFAFHCCDLTNNIVIFVDKAVPTSLANYLPTKNEKNRLSEPVRRVISLKCIPSQGMVRCSLWQG